MRRRTLVAAGMIWIALGSSAEAAQFTVSSEVDAVDLSVGDGVCDSGAGCTLRAAIQEANRASGESRITVPAGRYRLVIAPVPQAGSILDRDAANGDLDLDGHVALHGAGVGRTIVDGGGIDRVFATGFEGVATLTDMTITGGDATAGNSQEIDLGGGVLNNGHVTLERVELVANRADGGGGLFSIPRTKPVIRDSLIAANTAYEGGGLRIDSGATIVNTTITANALRTPDTADLARKPVGIVIPLVDEISGFGGGIDHRGGGDLTIVNSTITANQALKGGGGIAAGQGYVPLSEDLPLGELTLRNTIVAGNTSAAGPANCRTNQVRFTSLGHNLDTDGTCFLKAEGDRAKADPLLGALADNGGPTRTQALLTGSPAIDAGGADGCPAADPRGIARPQGSACDIGAFEYVAPAAAAPSCVRSVRLPARWRKRARSFDVLVGRRVVARKRRPAQRVTVRRAASRVTLRVRLRGGRTVRVKVKTTCRAA